MATVKSPAAKSATVNNAAKDDVVGHDGDFTFSINDLLANDPGGANKNGNFFFGGAADQNHQQAYMDAHGIVKISDADGGTYALKAAASINDFDYMVQIGGNGTWSQAHVTVEDRPDLPPPTPVGQQGNLLFSENFDGYGDGTAAFRGDHGSWIDANLGYGSVQPDGIAHGWADTSGGGALSELHHSPALATSGEYSLDTQNSPGRIDIKNWFVDPTGGKAQLSFDIAKQDWGAVSQTDPNASFAFKVDGVAVKTITAGQLEHANESYHFDVEFDVNGAGGHVLELVDLTQGANDHYTGFAVDSIQIHDWLV